MPEEKKAKIGFIGCGSHATGSLYPMIHLIPEIDLVAVCDLKGELAKRNARNFGARNWYANLDKMLSQEEMDGAIICGLPKMHCEVGKKCLDKGLPIFVEKPSAISYKEALDLAEYAENKRLWGVVAFMNRFATGYRTAKEIIGKKEFGKISFIEIKCSCCPYPAIWGIKENSKVFLIGYAIHEFDLIRHFCGDVERVYAELNQVSADRFGYAIAIRFKNGVVGTMNLNALEAPFDDWRTANRLAISGDNCYLEVDNKLHLRYRPAKEYFTAGNGQTFDWRPEWGEITGSGGGKVCGYRGELEHFAKCLLRLEKPRPDLWDGAKALQIAEAVWESSQSKKVVRIA